MKYFFLCYRWLWETINYTIIPYHGWVLWTYKKRNNLQQLLVSKICRCWWDQQCRLLCRLPYVYALSKFKEVVFYLQKAWHSSNTLLTQVHRVAICNIILHSLSRTTKDRTGLPPFSYLGTFYLDKKVIDTLHQLIFICDIKKNITLFL